jgi:hypothetical protein
VAAMAVFKQFVRSAQREFVKGEHLKNPASERFKGYTDK